MRLLARPVCCVLLVLFAVAGCARGDAEPAEPAPTPSAAPAATDDGHWAGVLDRLDEWRDAAFTRGDASLLLRVYTPRSPVLRRDRRLLRDYRRRGLELDSVRLQLTSVELDGRSRRWARLRVVDRLAPVRVRHDGGRWRTLPRDGLTEHVVVLQRVDGHWRIAGIRRLAG